MNRKTILFSLALGVALCAPAWSVDLGADFPALGFARGDGLNYKFDALNAGKAELTGSTTQVMQADEIQADTYRSAVGASTAIALGVNGIVSMPNQSYVEVYSAAVVYPPGTSMASFASKVSDAQTEWDVASNTFTPKVTGVYTFSYYMAIGVVTTTVADYFQVRVMQGSTDVGILSIGRASTTSYYPIAYGSVSVACQAGLPYSLRIDHDLDSGVTTGSGATYNYLRIAKIR